MILTYYDIDGDAVTFRAERRTVGVELYVVFLPLDGSEKADAMFKQATSLIRATVLRHLLHWPDDKYLARFITGENLGADDECYHEVQFKDRDDLHFPTWQRMLINPFHNSREAA